jgi:Family of unknown function (DUF6492)
MSRDIALITPSHIRDIERFSLLCDSLDARVSGYDRHYVLVNDSDVAAFACFASQKRVILPCSDFLPKWLRLLPSYLSRNGRRIWWSFRTPPVHGWHIQQILKIAAALQLPEERFCIIDSDNVFFRDFDIQSYAGGDEAPLYLDRDAISAEAPLHAVWTRNCSRLLGRPVSSFPADDFVGNLIVWDHLAVRDMTRAIEKATGMSWQEALCKTRSFSEYLLYGHFVRGASAHAARHRETTDGPVQAYWDEKPLDREEIAAMVSAASLGKVALCIESFSNTPISRIRDVVGLTPREQALLSA